MARRFLRINRPPAADPIMIIDGIEQRVVRIKVRDDVIEVLFEEPESLTPSADVPACRDEDPAWTASLAACYPEPPEYQHPED